MFICWRFVAAPAPSWNDRTGEPVGATVSALAKIVPSLWLYQDEKFVPVITAKSVARVTGPLVVGM